MDDLISRADVEQTVEDNILCYTHSDRPIDQGPDTECHMAIRTTLRMLRKDLRKLPSAQPPYNLDEWCYNCKEYDQERHCCPRFNRVIKQTKEDFEAQNEIIHCTDCRYHGTAICRIWSRYGTINVPGYGFCYRAERKEQDE